MVVMKAVILAAGEASRFWPLNTRHKSLFRIMGRPVIQYCIDSLRKAGIREIIIIQRPTRDIENAIAIDNPGIRFVVQAEPKGMGNALTAAENLIDDEFLVVNAERTEAGEFARRLSERKKVLGADAMLLASETKEPWLYGILETGGEIAKGITEKPAKGSEKSNIKAAGIYLLPKDFFAYHSKACESMYSFEDALSSMMKEKSVGIVMAEKEMPSLKYPWSLFGLAKSMMDSGLKKKISGSARIARSAVIEGNVHIGDNTVVFENAVIKGPCYIGDNCVIGNNTLVREYSDIESLSIIGANCEFARSLCQEDVHLHSGYVGDSVIGMNCRIGAGIITANLRLDRENVKTFIKGEKIDTGMKSLGCVIGENTRIGIGSMFMPGVMIGQDCTIGPGSLIDKNVESCRKIYAKIESFSGQ